MSALKNAAPVAPHAPRETADAGVRDADDRAPSERLDKATLDRSLLRGVAWTGSVKWLTQIAAWVSTLVVARQLSPTDYGLVGMAMVYLGFLTLICESGIGMTVIALREIRGQRLGEMHAISMLVGVAGFLVSCLLAAPLAMFFDAPALRWVVIALSGNFVLTALRTVPVALLQRDLRFARAAAVEGANSLVVAVTAVALAVAGYRYWALVGATLAGSVVATAIAMASVRIAPKRPHFGELRGTLRTSREIVVASIAWYVFQNADFFVAGKLLGSAALGAYTVAWNLAYSVVDKITSLVNGVTSSIFSAAKHDRALLTRYITQIAGVLALALLPATVGLALVSRELVLVVLGEKWRAAIIPLTLLVLYAGVRSVTPLLSQALTITGDTRYTMHRSLVAAVLLPLGFVVGARWGIVGIASAWMVVHAPVVLIPLLRRVSTHLGIGAAAYLAVIRPAVVSSAVMAGAVLLAAAALPASTSDLVVLVVKMVVGALSYGLTVWLLFRDRVMQLVRAFNQLRNRSSAVVAPAVSDSATAPGVVPTQRPGG